MIDSVTAHPGNTSSFFLNARRYKKIQEPEFD